MMSLRERLRHLPASKDGPSDYERYKAAGEPSGVCAPSTVVGLSESDFVWVREEAKRKGLTKKEFLAVVCAVYREQGR